MMKAVNDEDELDTSGCEWQSVESKGKSGMNTGCAIWGFKREPRKKSGRRLSEITGNQGQTRQRPWGNGAGAEAEADGQRDRQGRASWGNTLAACRARKSPNSAPAGAWLALGTCTRPRELVPLPVLWFCGGKKFFHGSSTLLRAPDSQILGLKSRLQTAL